MDKVTDKKTAGKRLHLFAWFTNMKIKPAFMVCMVLFIALFLSMFLAFLEYADYISDRIMSFYDATQELATGSSREYEIDNKEITIVMSNDDDRVLGDGFLLFISDTYLIVFLGLFALSVVLAGIAFYSLKLKKPMKLLSRASEKISSNELDFTLEYDSRDEMGELADSFEKMRSALYENNRKMWKTIDDEKKVYAAFAHDVRTPLTVVHGYTEFLETYIPEKKISEEKLLSTLHTVNENLIRLQGFVDTMSAIRTLDDLNVNIKKTDFGELCDRLEAQAQIICQGIRCEFVRKSDAPYICVDASAVEQVFGNLTANAVRYARECIRFGFSADNNVLSVTVNDDGNGFSDEALHRASELFYRENKESGTDSANHFGFGLYICKTLCEKHYGTLSISNKNGGFVEATFSDAEHNSLLTIS